eukprot:1190302-Prorocentrum_minimum.AAC.2
MVCQMITGYQQQRCSRFPEARLRVFQAGGLVPGTSPYRARLLHRCTVRQTIRGIIKFSSDEMCPCRALSDSPASTTRWRPSEEAHWRMAAASPCAPWERMAAAGRMPAWSADAYSACKCARVVATVCSDWSSPTATTCSPASSRRATIPKASKMALNRSNPVNRTSTLY